MLVIWGSEEEKNVLRDLSSGQNPLKWISITVYDFLLYTYSATGVRSHRSL